MPAVFVKLILPVVAPAGTVAVIEVADTTVKLVAAVPLNFTAVTPVNFVPVIVTVAPTLPLSGVNELMVGVTVKLAALVPVPLAVVILIGPVVAVVGTLAVS